MIFFKKNRKRRKVRERKKEEKGKKRKKRKKKKKPIRDKEQVNLKILGSLLENEYNSLRMVLFSPPPILRFLPWNGQLCAGCEKGL